MSANNYNCYSLNDHSIEKNNNFKYLWDEMFK
jgi:hypothetical protein